MLVITFIIRHNQLPKLASDTAALEVTWLNHNSPTREAFISKLSEVVATTAVTEDCYASFDSRSSS